MHQMELISSIIRFSFVLNDCSYVNEGKMSQFFGCDKRFSLTFDLLHTNVMEMMSVGSKKSAKHRVSRKWCVPRSWIPSLESFPSKCRSWDKKLRRMSSSLACVGYPIPVCILQPTLLRSGFARGLSQAEVAKTIANERFVCVKAVF